ncbi:hypothetical protein Goari_004260, partial [Gossypium aridum]|nr:hypothetical protein [Gossypium aridum]
YHHFGGRAITIEIAGGWVRTHWVELFGELCWNTYALKDIWLLLDQQLKAHDPVIRVVIPDEFFQNPNIWHVKVSLVHYATVEMH